MSWRERAARAGERIGEAMCDLRGYEVVGRNVLPGRWTFQVMEEFDETYYEVVVAAEARVRDELVAGRRHVYESELKDEQRTHGRAGHENRPADTASG